MVVMDFRLGQSLLVALLQYYFGRRFGESFLFWVDHEGRPYVESKTSTLQSTRLCRARRLDPEQRGHDTRPERIRRHIRIGGAWPALPVVVVIGADVALLGHCDLDHVA